MNSMGYGLKVFDAYRPQQAVDLTIVRLTGANKGKELDMGTPWDFFSPLSWPTSNEVTALQKSNRASTACYGKTRI